MLNIPKKKEVTTVANVLTDERPLISVRDKRTMKCYDPVLYNDVLDALRTAGMMMTKENHAVSAYPDEFELLHIANYTRDGAISIVNNVICSFSEIKKPELGGKNER